MKLNPVVGESLNHSFNQFVQTADAFINESLNHLIHPVMNH